MLAKNDIIAINFRNRIFFWNECITVIHRYIVKVLFDDCMLLYSIWLVKPILQVDFSKT